MQWVCKSFSVIIGFMIFFILLNWIPIKYLNNSRFELQRLKVCLISNKCVGFVSGLQIVFSLDEVAFIQNLVFYIESAYCIPVSNL